MLIMITNSISPYCYDIAHAIGLPTYFSYRFRYKSKLIHLPYSIQEIKNKEGLIVLRQFESGELIPLRYIKTEFVRSIGDINYIEFFVDKFINLIYKETIETIINKSLKEKSYDNIGEVNANLL